MFELRNVSSGYGRIPVLKDVSIEIDKGEVVCIVGGNGAGKTTLMRVISGLLPVWKGQKILCGKDVTHSTPGQLTRSGLIQVPEGRLIVTELSVEDNLLLGAYSHYFKAGKKRLRAALDEVYELFPRLEQRAKQQGGTLSGGEQQMLAIGRGLMGEPELLMLDEPSLGLAPMLVRDMFVTVKNLNEKGLGILLVEQNVRASLQVADRGYIMETGAVVHEGKATDLLGDEKVRKAYLGA